MLQYYLDDKENNQVVLFEGVVYDVKEYMPEHPGGSDYISDNLGKCINEDFYEAEHTKFARKIFNDLPVRGKMPQEAETSSTSSGFVKSPCTKVNGFASDWMSEMLRCLMAGE